MSELDNGSVMAGLFISYRQADSKAWAISLRDALVEVFGESQVFFDKDTLHAGNWRGQIHQALDRCTVALVVIGPRWLMIADDQGQPRIGLPDDVHHQEVSMALTQPGMTVIPVLVDEASMPRAELLPPDLHALCDQQAYKIGDTHARRRADLAVLVKAIQEVGGLTKVSQPQAEGQHPDAQEQQAWYRLDVSAVGISFALTVFSAILAYSSGGLGGGELTFLLIFFYALIIGGKQLWRRFHDRQRRMV